MSFDYYCNWWIVTKKQLEELTKEDNKFMTKMTPTGDRTLANKQIGGLYAKYCLLVQELDLCLDQLAQPQKTFTMRKLVEAAVMRLKELFDELKWVDFSEFHYIDDSLIELKLIPYDIEIIRPLLSYPRPYHIQQLYERLKNNERIFEKPKEVTCEEPTEDEDQEASKKKRVRRPVDESARELTEEEKEQLKIQTAVLLIQRHERARQARLFHMEAYAVHVAHLKHKTKDEAKTEAGSATAEQREKAAITLQRFYRGHYTRRLMRSREDKRQLLLGMTEPSWKSYREFEIEEQTIENRRRLREQRIQEYIDINLSEKDRVLRVVGPGLFEDIGDEIRYWFRVWYDEARTFDVYPPEKKGGTILVVRGETMTPKEYLDEVEKNRRKKVQAGGKKALKKKEREEKKRLKMEAKKERLAKKKREKKEKKERMKRRLNMAGYRMEFDPPDPERVQLYDDGLTEYHEIWDQRDERENPEEKVYVDMITEQKHYEVQLEIRQKVDEMMRLELDLLMMARAVDRGKKYKRKKAKKKKGGKRKGKKKGKDLTGDRTIEDLFQQLFDEGIIRLYPKTPLSDFFGDFSYNNYELRNYDLLEPPPTLGDVRQAVVLNCILPFGLETFAKRPKSVIICGVPGSGKNILANAVFTATRCVLFDLSPPVLAGKYPQNKGMKMLVHLVMKMARLLQPSILFIDTTEAVFAKKVPKADRWMQPKRLSKVLFKKMVKTIKPKDRVMLLGTCTKPWTANAKMKKAYEQAILIPLSDYGSVFLYWRKLLMPYHSVDRNIELSALTTMTVNYPLGVIKQVVKNVMTTERIIHLYHKPLMPQELFEPFLDLPAITPKVWKKYLKWYGKSKLGKLNKKYAKVKEVLRQQMLTRAQKKD